MIRYFLLLVLCASLQAEEFTICSYNCGGLSAYYDYYRAAASEKISQERYNAEPQEMALNEKIQRLALKVFYARDPEALKKWEQKGYEKLFNRLAEPPSNPQSPHLFWHQKSNSMLTPWNVRPIVLSDEETRTDFLSHLLDITRRSQGTIEELLPQAYATLASRIFTNELHYDIICLQETEFLSADLFPARFSVIFDSLVKPSMGIAWNKQRFDFIKTIGSVPGKGFVVLLKEKKTGKQVAIASGHLTGSNPYEISKNPVTGEPDSQKGDDELKEIVRLLNQEPSSVKVIAMDSNVAATHPRLQIMHEAGYQLDTENFLYPTCTNPYFVLNTRIDWIAALSSQTVEITNIPVLNVGLNSIRTNISDHRPVAANVKLE